MRGFFNFVFSRLFLCLLLIAAYIAAIIFLCIYLPTILSFGAAVLGVYLLSAIVALTLISRDGAPEFKCAWLCFIAAVPVLGAVTYVVCQYKIKPCERTLKFDNLSIPPQICYDECIYLDCGGQYFEKLFACIEGASKYVYLEYYIIAEGAIFSRLYSALERALSRGVEVKIMADGLGSALRLPRKKLKKLCAAGAQLKIFHKLFPLPLARLNFRDHRKIAVIDGKTAFSGGINIADEYAGLTSPHGYWKDTGFYVTGGAAEFFRQLFLSVWCGCRRIDAPNKAQGKRLLPLYDSPPAQSGLYANAVICAIERANERVWAFTPYLCPDERIKRALMYAAERGVDVKIIIPHIPDKKLTFTLSRAFARELKEKGVEVYEYSPGFMHAKGVICDAVCILGSYNLDFRSMHINYECGIQIENGVTRQVAADFEACLALSAPVSAARKKWYIALLKLFAPLA